MGSSSAAQKETDRFAPAVRQVFRFGVFELDARSGELRRHGLKVRLPHQAFRILALLLDRAGEVVSRDELRELLWPAGTFVDFEVGLNSAVRKLRDALDDSAEDPKFIETLPRHGYRFIGSIEAAGDRASQPQAAGSAPGTRWGRRIAVAALVALAAAITALALGPARGLSSGAPVGEIRSLAVLPFENLTGDPAQAHVADGITDALTTDLAQIEPLNVISRSSASRYNVAADRAPDIGRDLNVDALVQGAVVRSGHHLRISARVIHAASDRHMWARNYDGELGNILALQRRIAGDVAAAVGHQLSSHASRSRAVDPAAADAYLKGIQAAGQIGYGHERMSAAVAYFEDAITKQPDYAEAYAALAAAQLQFLFMGPWSPRQVIPKAEAAARKAIELDETLAQPHRTLSTILRLHYWKREEANEHLRRAEQLGAPAEPTRMADAGMASMDRSEAAIADAVRDRDLDPRSISAQIGVGVAYRSAVQYERAIAEFHRALELAPEHRRTRFQLAVTYVLMGRPSEAIPELEAAVQPVGRNPRMLAYLGYAYAAAGRTGDARRVLHELVSRSGQEYVSSFGIALIHDVLGEKERAIAAVERAYDDRAVELAQLSQYPPFTTIATDPRYAAVRQGVGVRPPSR